MRTFRRIRAVLRLMIGSAALSAAAISAASADRAALRLGVSWYPEQWPEERWERDLALMQAAGIDTVRIAEFAWSRMEPEEGRFDFGWLDRVVAACAKHGIGVILGTPTASPPIWLVRNYNVSRLNEDGTRSEHGFRRNFSFANQRYRELGRRIATEMATRYGHNSNVIGWQIDNEIASMSFDKEAQQAFHEWLKARYGTIDALNRRWTTAYWSQTYRSFDEIDMHANGPWNPALLLDTRRFGSDMWASYIRNQIVAIRKLADPRQFVTTNTKSWNGDFDHYIVNREVDIAGFDNYFLSGRPDWAFSAAELDRVRGYKNRNFLLLESQPGRIGWNPINRGMDKGVLHEAAWQAIGHGADMVLYWQWRSALNGQEQYHDTFIGPDGEPMPQYAELAQVGAEFAKLAPLFAGTAPVSRVAMLWSYDSRWALDAQRNQKEFDPVREFLTYYRQIQPRAQSVDVVSPDADLSHYAVVVAPSLHVMNASQASRLEAYVRGGGHLLLGVRSGMKDEDNALATQRQPGLLTGLLGARVEQFFALDEKIGVAGMLGAGSAQIWAERLQPRASDVTVLERFLPYDGWVDGQPAIVTRSVGQGSITYAGGWFDDALTGKLIDRTLALGNVTPILPGLPATVEVMERSGAGRRLLLILNHGAEAVPVPLPGGANLLLGTAGQPLAPHGVMIARLPATGAR